MLEKCVFKKVFSWLKATHSGEVEGKRAEDQELTARTEDEFDTDNTDIMHEGDESPELNEQVCTAETRGACVHRGDLPFQVRQAKHFLSLTEHLHHTYHSFYCKLLITNQISLFSIISRVSLSMT